MPWGLKKREPDFVIGPKDDPYMRRWYVIPRNKWFNIYLHNMKKSDYDRALHDHPWWNVSVVMRGGYWEYMPEPLCRSLHFKKWRKAGAIVVRKATALHRLELPEDGEAWSLFITGRTVRVWGFMRPNGWRPYTDVITTENGVSVTKGCPD